MSGEPDPARIGERLHLTRAALGLSMGQVAAETGIPKSVVHKAEHGGDIRVSAASRIVRWLNTKGELMFDAPLTHEEHHDLIHRREQEALKLARARRGPDANGPTRRDRADADAIVKAGLTLVVDPTARVFTVPCRDCGQDLPIECCGCGSVYDVSERIFALHAPTEGAGA